MPPFYTYLHTYTHTYIYLCGFPAWVSVPRGLRTEGGQKRVLDPLGLALHMIVSCHVDTGN